MEKVRPPLSLLHNTGENSFRTQHLCWEVVSGLVESLPSNALRLRGAQILHECGIRSRFPYQDLLWLYDCRHDHTILLLPPHVPADLETPATRPPFSYLCRGAAVHQTQKNPGCVSVGEGTADRPCGGPGGHAWGTRLAAAQGGLHCPAVGGESNRLIAWLINHQGGLHCPAAGGARAPG
jgi:hypothetical protein